MFLHGLHHRNRLPPQRSFPKTNGMEDLVFFAPLRPELDSP